MASIAAAMHGLQYAGCTLPLREGIDFGSTDRPAA